MSLGFPFSILNITLLAAGRKRKAKNLAVRISDRPFTQQVGEWLLEIFFIGVYPKLMINNSIDGDSFSI